MNHDIVRLVNEVLDRGYEYNWTIRNDYEWAAEFTTKDGRQYRIRITRADDPEDKTTETLYVWYIAFWLLRRGQPTTRATGTGDQFRILATVVNAMREFVKSDTPILGMLIGAKEQSRRDLYRSLIDRYLIPEGYFIKSARRHGRYLYYEVRPNLAQWFHVHRLIRAKLASSGRETSA